MRTQAGDLPAGKLTHASSIPINSETSPSLSIHHCLGTVPLTAAQHLLGSKMVCHPEMTGDCWGMKAFNLEGWYIIGTSTWFLNMHCAPLCWSYPHKKLGMPMLAACHLFVGYINGTPKNKIPSRKVPSVVKLGDGGNLRMGRSTILHDHTFWLTDIYIPKCL